MRSEQRVYDFDVGAPPARSAWDPADPSNFAVISRGGNDTYLMRNDDSGRGGFRKGYTRCLGRRVRGGGGGGRRGINIFTSLLPIIDRVICSRGMESLLPPVSITTFAGVGSRIASS